MAIDPVMVGLVAGAVNFLATEVAKGVASEAGKTLWGKVRSLFGWSADPAPDKLKQETEARLASDPLLAIQVVALLQAYPSEPAAQLVGHVIADKVVVAKTINANSFTM